MVDTFEDIDISAFKLKAKRPEFERMLVALRAGEIGGVVVWKLDRLTRQQRDLVRVMEACEIHKAFIASVMEPIDTRESYGQFVAELLVAQARMESANTSARLRRKARELSEQGAPPTNGKRCFGYEQGYLTMFTEEAAILREVRDRVFVGESMRAICFDLEERGVRSPQGNAIRDNILKRTLLSPSLAGQRELDGVRYPGTWPAIFTPEESLRLRSILVRRPGVRREAPARRYLLNGLLRCGRCTGRMRSHLHTGDVRRYICEKRPGYVNCGSMSVRADDVEDLVRQMLIAAVDDGGLRKAILSQDAHDDGLLDAVRQDELSLEVLSKDFYVEQLLSRDEFLAARGDLNSRLETNRTRLAERSRSRVLGELVTGQTALQDAWELKSVEWRRSVVGALLEKVMILPGQPGRRPFDPARVQPVWRY